MLNSNLAPLVLFVYNRPHHTLECLKSVQQCILSDQTSLYVFCDGPKIGATESEIKMIMETREIVKSQNWCGQVNIKENKLNVGLADSVIQGVTEIVNLYGNVIVVEDDLILGMYFLEYMNTALTKYEKSANVMQIAGYTYPAWVERGNTSFFLSLTTTWGWSTWKHVWNNVDFHPSDFREILKDKKSRFAFNFFGSFNYTQMLFQQMNKPSYGSWGIRFWWHAFKNSGKVLYPDGSLVRNIGFDNSGVHKPADYDLENWDREYKIINFEEDFVSPDRDKTYNIINYLKSKLSLRARLELKLNFSLK